MFAFLKNLMCKKTPVPVPQPRQEFKPKFLLPEQEFKPKFLLPETAEKFEEKCRTSDENRTALTFCLRKEEAGVILNKGVILHDGGLRTVEKRCSRERTGWKCKEREITLLYQGDVYEATCGQDGNVLTCGQDLLIYKKVH